MKNSDTMFHGKGVRKYRVILSADCARSGWHLYVNADNAQACMAYAKAFDIFRVMTREQYGEFCKEEGSAPYVTEIFDMTSREEVYHYMYGF